MSEPIACPNPVEWQITFGRGPDDATKVCPAHVEKMLGNVYHQARVNAESPTITRVHHEDKIKELKCCFIEQNPEVAALFSRITKLENQIEQLRVQAAGCSVAATGYIKGENACKPGQYGWSRGYEDVKTLYLKYDQAYKALKKIEEIAAEAHPWIAMRVQEGLKDITTS